jgi:putative acetyltransferase
MKIRLFEKPDAPQVAQLFHETVREINSRDYSTAQVMAWAPSDLYFRDWAAIGAHPFTYVADDAGVIAGFGELEKNGHIGCFYCHKHYQRCGVGRQIYQAIEAKAVEVGMTDLFTEASITAKPFFQRMGFSIIQEQEVICRGAVFINYAMQKSLRDLVKPSQLQPSQYRGFQGEETPKINYGKS